jgi:hypothetical protein
MPRVNALFVSLIAAAAITGCAANTRDDRPETWRQVCQENGAITCAMDARRDTCAGRATEDPAACESAFVAECCGLLGDPAACDQPPTFTPATYSDFDACHDAVVELSCSAVEDSARPADCDGVIK